MVARCRVSGFCLEGSFVSSSSIGVEQVRSTMRSCSVEASLGRVESWPLSLREGRSCLGAERRSGRLRGAGRDSHSSRRSVDGAKLLHGHVAEVVDKAGAGFTFSKGLRLWMIGASTASDSLTCSSMGAACLREKAAIVGRQADAGKCRTRALIWRQSVVMWL